MNPIWIHEVAFALWQSRRARRLLWPRSCRRFCHKAYRIVGSIIKKSTMHTMEIKSIIILGQSEIGERRKSLREGIGWVVPDLHEKRAGVRHPSSKQCRSLKKRSANEIKKRKAKFCCRVARGSAPEQLSSVGLQLCQLGLILCRPQSPSSPLVGSVVPVARPPCGTSSRWVWACLPIIRVEERR